VKLRGAGKDPCGQFASQRARGTGAGIAHYDEANRYLATGATHGPRRRQPVIIGDDPRRDNYQVFWLEEERVVSEDWLVRYKNRLLQLEPAESTLGTGQELRAGAGERSRRSRDSLSQSASGVPRTEGRFYSAERGKGCCPFPRGSIPKSKV
jgi:hypothetical protein